MAKYLVTGGAGFIGSHLTDKLIDNGHDVIVYDNLYSGRRENVHPNAKFVFGNIEWSDSLESVIKDVDAIFHLAAIVSVQDCIENWKESHNTNVGGTIEVFKLATKYDIPVVYASSAAVYGKKEYGFEEQSLFPISPYGADKLTCELQAAAFKEIYGLRSCGLRFFNVYGPRQNSSSPYSGVISKFMNCLKNDEKPVIYGDGLQSRDFVYVSDVVDALILAMGKEGVYNVCTGKATNLLQILSYLGCDDPNFEEVRKGDIRHSLGDRFEAWQNLKFNAKIGVKTGLKMMLEEVRNESS